jgi:deoxyribodipyrimidine photo-lyase
MIRPATVGRDRAVKAALGEAGLEAEPPGHLLHEPWDVADAGGRVLQGLQPVLARGAAATVPAPLPGIGRLPAPERWPASEALADWRLGAAMNRGAEVVGRFARVGEAAARAARRIPGGAGGGTMPPGATGRT